MRHPLGTVFLRRSETPRPASPDRKRRPSRPRMTLAPDIAGSTLPTAPVDSNVLGSTAVLKFDGPSRGDAGPTDTCSYFGGNTVGAADLQLLFWGNAWQTAAAPSADDVIRAVEAVLDSPYLGQLDQYGVEKLHLRGSLLLLTDPPSPTFQSTDLDQLIWDLIDQGTFPDPDEDGGRIVYMVLAPPGTRHENADYAGAHRSADDADFLDIDTAWIAFANYAPGDLPALLKTVTHEIVETLSDPENDDDHDDAGWRMGRDLNGGAEIGDACWHFTYDLPGGVRLQAYWSERHKACVVPVHAYRASCHEATRTADASVTVAEGTHVVPEPEHVFLCRLSEVRWFLLGTQETVTVVALLSGYADPVVTWSVGGVPVTAGAGTVTVPGVSATIARAPSPGDSLEALANAYDTVERAVRITYRIRGHEIALTNDPRDGQYTVEVRVSARERSRPDYRATDATGKAPVSFRGLYLSVPELAACARKAIGPLIRPIDRLPLLPPGLPGLSPGHSPGHSPPGDPWIERLPAYLSAEDRATARVVSGVLRRLAPHDADRAASLRSAAAFLLGVHRDTL